MSLPEITPILIESSKNKGPYGAKGFGEHPIMGPPAAIANANNDAIGIRVKEMPITPEKILEALEEKDNHHF